MTRFTSSLVTIATVLTWMLVTPAHPQTTSPSPAPIPGASPAQEAPKDKQVEGTIKMVRGSTVTLEDGTQLSIPASVRVAQDLKPGAQISAEYEERGGQKIATSIQIKG